MNKKVLFAATVAAMLASCSSDDLSLTSSTSSKQLLTDENGNPGYFFDGNSQRSLTRAGYAGVMNTDQLKASEADGGGFGVFGYYTDLNEYDQSRSSNFMYNQGVFYSGGSWTYEPIKYWPNEYGSKAQSDDVDKVTFFAYAPYTKHTTASGKVAEDQVGITGFTRNTAAGDPYVKYVGSLDPTKCVDLCWGVADPSADVEWKTIQGGSQTIFKGKPWINVQRPEKSLGQKMKFFFKHALSQLNVQIDADVNTNQHGAGAEVDSKTKVYVRSITFNGFAMKGALNLNNEDANTPNWKGYNCSNEPIVAEEYTIYDGMKDGQEGTGYTASNEKVTGLNATIIQDKKWGEAAEGVTKTAKNLFNSATATAPIYVIPTGDNMSVTIVYDIETKDDNLAGTVSDNETNGVSIKSEISKTITLTSGDALKLEAGKKYTIQLHLGLSQVEFDAVVSDWDDSAAAGEAWLPENGAPGPNSISISGADAITAASNYAGQLTAAILPAEADQSVTWSSSNSNLLDVDANGNVSLVSLNGIDINGEDVTITATSNDDGSISAQVTIPVAPVVGMFVGADGKAYTSTDAATTAVTTAEAYIAYVSATTGDSRAIALTNDATGVSWNAFNSNPGWNSTPSRDAISGATWQWPTKTDFNNMVGHLQTLSISGNGVFRDGFSVYWGITEADANHASALSFGGSNSLVYDGHKANVNSVYFVRAVLAF